MDVFETRRKRLRALVKDRFEESPTEFGAAIDRPQDYVSRLLSNGPHRKNLGEKLARHIEARLDLPVGWLDEISENKGFRVSEAPPPPYAKPGKTDYPMLIAKRVSTLDEGLQLALLNLVETFIGASTEKRKGPKATVRR